MADVITIRDAAGQLVDVSVDDVTSLNGGAVTGVHVQRFKAVFGADAAGIDVSAANPFPVKDSGTYGYAAGTAAGSVDVPTGARIKRVSVLAGASAAGTVTILGGATITVPAGGGFDDQLPGDAIATSSTNEVVIGGTVQAYYVGWVV
jgi:hypothetical protein